MRGRSHADRLEASAKHDDAGEEVTAVYDCISAVCS